MNYRHFLGATRATHSLHVLHVGPGRGQRGGVASVLNELATQESSFANAGISMSFFETRGFRGIKNLLGFFFLDFPRFGLAMLGSKVEVVHFHVSARGSFYRKCMLFLVAKSAGKRTIFHLHSGDFQQFQSSAGKMTRRAVSWFIGTSNATMAVSTATAAELVEYREANDVYIVGNTARDTEFAECGNASGIQSKADPPYIAFAGRLSEAKGLGDLLNAIALLRHEGLAVHLKLAGIGDINRWSNHALQLGVGDCVTFTGWLVDEAKVDFYRQASLFCMPSHFESFGIATLEAMFSGLPIIGTRLGGFLDLVQSGVTGYLVEPEDVRALATRIRTLIEDPALSLKMGAAARSFARQHYSTNVIVEKYVRCYRNITVKEGDPQ